MFNMVNGGTVSSGFTAGLTVQIPFKKGSSKKIAFDYAFEYTQIFQGTHSIGLKLNL